jgi:nicotinamidase-related amidase
MITIRELPVPDFYDPAMTSQIWQVPYSKRIAEGEEWAEEYCISDFTSTNPELTLLMIDVQNTFCIPHTEQWGGELYVPGAEADTRRLCEFIYKNVSNISQTVVTLDTHKFIHIFHPIFWVNEKGEHPAPYLTTITRDDLVSGKWKVNPKLSKYFSFLPKKIAYRDVVRFALEYVFQLETEGKYSLTIWPYHGMNGGIGNALVSSIEEAIVFHSAVVQNDYTVIRKGEEVFTEFYSAFQPEVTRTPASGYPIQNTAGSYYKLLNSGLLVIAGQAKSHCVSSSINDLLNFILRLNPQLAQNVYILEDCMSAIPNFEEETDSQFQRFAEAGMNIVKSTDPMATWPGMSKYFN